MDAGACLIRASRFALHCMGLEREVHSGGARLRLRAVVALLQGTDWGVEEAWADFYLALSFPLFFLDPSLWAGNHPWVCTIEGLAGTRQDPHARLK